jgi:hypothetical protein
MLGYNIGIVVVSMSGFPCKENLHKRGFIRVGEKDKIFMSYLPSKNVC